MTEESPIKSSSHESSDGRLSGYQLVQNIIDKFDDQAINKLLEVADRRETAYLELKASTQLSEDDKRKNESLASLYWDIAQGIYAIGNTSGGILIIGIDNNCQAVKVLDENVKDLDEFLRKKIDGKILPQHLTWTDKHGKKWCAQERPDVEWRICRYHNGKDVPDNVVAALIKPLPAGKFLILERQGDDPAWWYIQRKHGLGGNEFHKDPTQFKEIEAKREIESSSYFAIWKRLAPEDATQSRHGSSGAYRLKKLKDGDGSSESAQLLQRTRGHQLTSSLNSGDCVGGYEIVAKIGAGGMGTVYRVRKPIQKQHLALKAFTPPSNAADLEAMEGRFITEALMLGALEHPYIPHLIEINFDEHANCLYFVMDLVESDDPGTCHCLSDYSLAPGNPESKIPATDVQALQWLKELCEIVDYLHAQGIVHRDIKLSNVLIGREKHVHLADFGIVKVADPEIQAQVDYQSTMTVTQGYNQSKPLLGSMAYLAPEVRNKKGRPSKQSDVWAIGITFFKLVSGEWFEGQQLQKNNWCSKHDIWYPLVGKMLEFDSADRPSCREIISEIDKVLTFTIKDPWPRTILLDGDNIVGCHPDKGWELLYSMAATLKDQNYTVRIYLNPEHHKQSCQNKHMRLLQAEPTSFKFTESDPCGFQLLDDCTKHECDIISNDSFKDLSPNYEWLGDKLWGNYPIHTYTFDGTTFSISSYCGNTPLKGGTSTPIFSTVPNPVSGFIGRTGELARMQDAFNLKKVLLVHAPGGTGKTQLVFKYVHDHLNDYPGGCFYVPAETCGSWNDVLQTLVSQKLSNLGITTAAWLGFENRSTNSPQNENGPNQPQDGNRVQTNHPSAIDGPEIVNALRQKANANGSLLVVMDNVEYPGRFFTDEQLRKIFPLGIPGNCHFIATARISRGLYDMRAPSASLFQLADLNEDDALELLNGSTAFRSDEEQAAARSIVRLLGYRALFVSRVGKLAAEGSRKAYSRILHRLEKDKLMVTQPLEDEEDTRVPEVIWDWTRKHLEKSPNGNQDLELVRALALFPADGIPERTLEALYYSEFGRLDAPTTLANYRDDPDLFQDAVKRLQEFSIVQRAHVQSDDRYAAPQDVILRMHRLDRAAVRKELVDDFDAQKQKIGKALTQCLCCESSDWIGLARAHSELMEFCPWEQLSGRAEVEILTAMPECQNYGIIWDRLSDYDWTGLIYSCPQFASRPEFQPKFLSPFLAQIKTLRPKFIMQDLPGAIWSQILQHEPELIDECPLHRLKVDDWLMLLREQPQLLDKCEHPEILGAKGNLHVSHFIYKDEFPVWEDASWGQLLARRPEFANHCQWDELSSLETISILTHAIEFAHRIPAKVLKQLTGEQWTNLITTNPQAWNLNCYPKDTFPQKVNGPVTVDFDREKIYDKQFNDFGIKWERAIKDNPKVRDVCPYAELPIEEWIILLLNDKTSASKDPPWEGIASFLSKNDLWNAYTDLFDMTHTNQGTIGERLEYEQLNEYRPTSTTKSRLQKAKDANPIDQLRDSKTVSLSQLMAIQWDSNSGSISNCHPQLLKLARQDSHNDFNAYCSFYDMARITLAIPHGLDFSEVIPYRSKVEMDGETIEYDAEDRYDLSDDICHITNAFNQHSYGVSNLPPPHYHREWAILISCCPELADKYDWHNFDGKEQCLILANHPSLRDRCDFKKFTGRDWAALLAEDPSFADQCNWSLLDDSDWEYLLNDRPWFAAERR